MSEDRKYRVLVVDDEASVLITYRLILEQQGYDVVAIPTAREAVVAVEKQDFDVILCDYSLEEQHTGFEVIAAARNRSPGVPAALLTGYATLETADEAGRQGIGIMYKPIEIDEFLATTSRMLRRENESHQEGNKETTDSAQDGGESHADSRSRAGASARSRKG